MEWAEKTVSSHVETVLAGKGWEGRRQLAGRRVPGTDCDAGLIGSGKHPRGGLSLDAAAILSSLVRTSVRRSDKPWPVSRCLDSPPLREGDETEEAPRGSYQPPRVLPALLFLFQPPDCARLNAVKEAVREARFSFGSLD